MRHCRRWPAACVLFCGFAAAEPQPGALRAGAARMDITPAADAALPLSGYDGRKEGFQAIHDKLNVRALVLDDGSEQAAIVVWETIQVPNKVWAELAGRISQATGIPQPNILIAAVHTHSAPALDGGYSEVPPASVAYTARIQEAAVKAVVEARARLRPARAGFATGEAFINVNRRALTANGLWWLGVNPDFPSDKTLAVLKIESDTGEPIALLANYAVHAVTMGSRNFTVSGDLAGAASRFVEQALKDRAVALWTSGAAGDQNPISRAPGSDFTLVEAYGQILGEEILRVAAKVKTTPHARIHADQRVVTCPGRRVEAGPRPRKEYSFNDADPVSIRISVLRLNDIALAGVSGEVLVNIGRRLKRESPLAATVMITHANGSSGYIPDDAAYQQVGYEITTSRLRPGCAEDAIVNGVLEMLNGQ